MKHGTKNATYNPATPASRNENDRSVTHIDPINGGIAAMSLQNMDAMYAAFLSIFILSFSTVGSDSFEPALEQVDEMKSTSGISFVVAFTKGVPDDASKLFPSVFAMRGNTLNVSKAGNMTTKRDAIMMIH